ncbi:MAG: shikimate kinase [Blastocatellia bacterium]|nr:shikimate kinase [Blastocatellia bacterium]MCS7156429.1 shikimate kinase [Blastocatellia bacterium]MCX7751830.1 shikimate kinase [Blastocatellia bacterium]MDW8168932.1 shikimate kinase [Acidobacteriota bacterium]MDW8256692.1 shikimate kinase [Acidobacteriota bacterium]
MRIFLVGFMGSGKTTVGRLLAEKLGYAFLDLDELIQEQAGLSIREIFARMGEGAFREMESRALRELEAWEDVVVALGGGAFVSEGNRREVKRLGVSVWLDCPLEVILARLSGTSDRPLYRSAEQMRALLEARLPAYQQADLRVDAGSQAPEAVADEIMHRLSLRPKRP